MNIQNILFVVSSLLLTLLIHSFIDANIFENIAIFTFFYIYITFLFKFGLDLNINYLPIIFSLLQLLIMPMLVYRIYNDDEFMVVYQYTMQNSEESYYGFVLPAILMMSFGLLIPLKHNQLRSLFIKNAIQNCRQYLIGKDNIGIVMIIIGAVSRIVTQLLSNELIYLSYLLNNLIYVGILYVFYSDSKNKKVYLLVGIAFLVIQSLAGGMFGDLIYTILLSSFILFLGRKISLSKKILLSLLGIFIILNLQVFKREYRRATWFKSDYVIGKEESTGQLLYRILFNNLLDFESLFDKDLMKYEVARFNQGMIVDKVISYVPSKRPYAGGETIVNSILASFIPRFLWPDKPQAGGIFNMEYFTGYIIEGYSVNIGPFGEAYGNFGTFNGIIFMFFYGLYFNIALFLIINISRRKPTLILWIPFLFLNSIQVETDILLTVNSLIKNSLFVWLCYWGAYRFMRIEL